MRQNDYHSLMGRGRKAGLGTGELLSAMAGRRPEMDRFLLGPDGNGFVADYGRHGQRVYRPTSSRKRS